MRRREFLKLAGGAAAVRPLTVHAQPVGRIHRIGLLMSTAENERDEKASVGAFIEGLRNAGWVEGSNLVVDYRWAAGDPQRMQEYTWPLRDCPPRPSRNSVSGRIVCGRRCLSRVRWNYPQFRRTNTSTNPSASNSVFSNLQG
jgi:hypothetical protein